MSESQKGHVVSDDAKLKMSLIKKGIPLSDEHKQKLKENHKGNTGKHLSDKTKNKIKEAQQKLNNEQALEIRSKYATGNYI